MTINFPSIILSCIEMETIFTLLLMIQESSQYGSKHGDIYSVISYSLSVYIRQTNGWSGLWSRL